MGAEWLMSKMNKAYEKVMIPIRAVHKTMRAIHFVMDRVQKIYQGARWCEQYEWSPTTGITITLSYALDVTMEVKKFKFDWSNPYNVNTLGNHACALETEIEADWMLFTLLVVDLEATYEHDWDVLTYERTDIFPIGPVPVIMKSHVNLNIGLALKKIHIRTTHEWEYGERWTFGYNYEQNEKGEAIKGEPLYLRQRVRNHHENKMEILDEEGNPTCPIVWGIDFIATPELGTSLYYMLKAYLKVPITVALTVDFPVPEKSNLDYCADPSYNTWYFSPAYQIDVELIVGGKANPPGITGYEGKDTSEKIRDIMDAFRNNRPPDLKDLTAVVEFSPFGKMTVIPKTPLGNY